MDWLNFSDPVVAHPKFSPDRMERGLFCFAIPEQYSGGYCRRWDFQGDDRRIQFRVELELLMAFVFTVEVSDTAISIIRSAIVAVFIIPAVHALGTMLVLSGSDI
jgi:hypothetical protein